MMGNICLRHCWYAKFIAAVEECLFAFPSSYMVEAGFNHINTIPIKHWNIFMTEPKREWWVITKTHQFPTKYQCLSYYL